VFLFVKRTAVEMAGSIVYILEEVSCSCEHKRMEGISGR
jgi:hypothetical protein